MHPVVKQQIQPTGSRRSSAMEMLVSLAILGAPGAAAQTGLQPPADSSRSGWVVLLSVALLVALVAAVFWNRRLAHEKRERRRLEQRLADVTSPLEIGLFEARVFPDGEVRLLFSNKATRDLLRLDNTNQPLKLDDRLFSSYLHAEDEPRIRQSIKRSIESLEQTNETFRYMQANGKYRWMQADISVRVMDDGGVIWTGAVRDLTSERELNEQLRQLTASKDLFFAAASHELRTPVHSIGLALEQLAQDSPQMQSPALQSAQEASELLRVLLDDLLELARVQPEELILRPVDFSLRSMLDDLAHNFQAAFDAKSIKLTVSIEQDVPDALKGDHQRLQQVLANLVSNGLRFSSAGEVTVSVSTVGAVPDDSDFADTLPAEVMLLFAVVDHGEGISPDRLERVFEPFVGEHAIATDALARRIGGQQSTAPASTGTGLGLAICQQIIKRMGGRIWLESVPGRGTAARFEIPLARSAGVAAAPQRLRPEPTTDAPGSPVSIIKSPVRKRRNLLLVDDDRLGRTLMATLLSSEGYLVTEAGTGEEALDKFNQGVFDAVVTDLRMPGMDGETLAARIRSLSVFTAENGVQTPDLPSRNVGLTPRPRLIALSASLGGGDVDHRADKLFDKRLQKPVGVDQLVDVLET